jgi:hypothetical protein
MKWHGLGGPCQTPGPFQFCTERPPRALRQVVAPEVAKQTRALLRHDPRNSGRHRFVALEEGQAAGDVTCQSAAASVSGINPQTR